MANEFPANAAGPNSPIRVLVVDDFAPWRQRVRSVLKAWPDLLVTAEASDGLEAIRKAEELRPDLIILDVGLPSMNGIEAARQLRKVVPESKIIVLSQETAADVVMEAIRLGVRGYVAKVRAETDLIKAVEIVLRGKHSFSTCIATDKYTETRAESPES